MFGFDAVRSYKGMMVLIVRNAFTRDQLPAGKGWLHGLEFDGQVMTALRRILACDLPADSKLQAALPTCQGGVGLFPASGLVAAALVAWPATQSFLG